MGISDALQAAGASPMFWIVLAIVLVVAVVGYLATRRATAADPAIVVEQGRVVHDWLPTGRIDFAGPSMDAGATETPATFFLQAEEIRLLVSISGIERKEIRWRKATLTEAKRVVNIFHRQMAKEPDRSAEGAAPSAVPAENAEQKGLSAADTASPGDFAVAQGRPTDAP
jgi:hypothetical protein